MPKSYLIDVDGVIVRGSELIPGADDFVRHLHERDIKNKNRMPFALHWAKAD